eukprot:GDKH01005566.1.p1 GENE.GDKH01005566.1~~GDKH01005566.1.p1  ORF type:complete len:242 (+),score=32.77 GDKH01005566.1:120-845(+)
MYDPEANQPLMGMDNAVIDDKTDQILRRGFIRKVYGILACQLLLTTVIGGVLVLNDAARLWLNRNPEVLIASLVGSLVCILAIACCPGVARTVPGNYICLFLFTFFEGILVGAVASQYTPESVLGVFALTSAIVIGLTIFAMTTKSDFTGAGPYLFAILFGLIVCSFFLMFFHSTLARKMVACGGALLFSCYIVYDTQLVCSGRHAKYRLSIDEYVFAALNIYLDIINLFLYLLELFGDRR